MPGAITNTAAGAGRRGQRGKYLRGKAAVIKERDGCKRINVFKAEIYEGEVGMKRLGILMLAMAILMLFGCETAVPEEIATAPAYDIQAQLEKAERLFLEGNYEEVILTLDTVLEIEPANVRGIYACPTRISQGANPIRR